jgi:hypothetical protein
VRGAGITAALAPPPWHPPWLTQISFINILHYIWYPMVLTGILAVVTFCQIWNLLSPTSNFILDLKNYNNLGYRNLLYPLHVSNAKRRKHSSRLRRTLCLCALDKNVFTDVINLDSYNMFLLGLTFQGILMLLQDFLLLHQLILLVSHNLLAIAQIHFLKHPRKPPDSISQHTSSVPDPVASSYAHDTAHGLIACSSAIGKKVSELDIFT